MELDRNAHSVFLLTTGGAPIEAIRKYIESQGEKDGKQSVQIQNISK